MSVYRFSHRLSSGSNNLFPEMVFVPAVKLSPSDNSDFLTEESLRWQIDECFGITWLRWVCPFTIHSVVCLDWRRFAPAVIFTIRSVLSHFFLKKPDITLDGTSKFNIFLIVTQPQIGRHANVNEKMEQILSKVSYSLQCYKLSKKTYDYESKL